MAHYSQMEIRVEEAIKQRDKEKTKKLLRAQVSVMLGLWKRHIGNSWAQRLSLTLAQLAGLLEKH